jgi:two-component system sensor histidine kinase HupT/HoxJ
MPSMLYESALTFAVLAIVTTHVAARQEDSGVRWLVLSLLATMLAWTGGLTGFFLFETGDVASASLLVAFLGVLTVPPCWLLLAVRQTHVHFFDERPGWLLAVLVPWAMSLLAIVTNSGHRLFLRDFQRPALLGPPSEWAGPLFWASMGWAALLMVLGVGLYLGAARQMVANGDTRRGVALAAVVTTPLVASPIVGVWLGRDYTPSLMTVSVLMLFVLNWRHRVLDTLPVARRDVIEHLPDGVLVADREGAILDANPAALRLVGMAVAELRRRPLARVICDLAVEEDAGALAASLRRMLSDGESAVREFRGHGERLLELDAACVRGGDGLPSGYYALLRNRSEQRRQEIFLRQSQRLETVAALSVGIAHEINNPLAFVRSNLSHMQRLSGQLGQELCITDSEKREELAELHQVAEESLEGLDRIAETLDRMRRFSRLKDHEIAEVDVNEVVRDAVKLAQARTDSNCRVELDLASKLRRVSGSAEHLMQAVLNIVVNAKQALAGRRNALLQVRTRRAGDGIEIRIADNGPGIPDDLQERIFDAFEGNKGASGGAGLGLAIAFGIVREHHGTLDMDSREGEGSEFLIRLPVFEASAAKRSGPAA